MMKATFMFPMFWRTPFKKYKPGTITKFSFFKNDNRLSNPSGIVYDFVRKRLIVVTRATGEILAVGMDGKISSIMKTKIKNLHGIDWGREDDLLVSDESAGTSFDYAHNLILVPSSKGNVSFTIS